MAKQRMPICEVRELIEAQYGLFPPSVIAEQAGRTVGYIKCIASAMGIKSVGRGRGHAPLWTIFQLRRLREAWGRVPTAQLAREFNRTPHTVAQKAHRLGLRRNKPWTDHDEAYLRANYSNLGSRQCAIELGRSIDSIQHRARRLKLRVAHSHRWTSEIHAEVQAARKRGRCG